MEKFIYKIPTLKVLAASNEKPFCNVSLTDIDEDEDGDEAANEGLFEDWDSTKRRKRSLWD